MRQQNGFVHSTIVRLTRPLIRPKIDISPIKALEFLNLRKWSSMLCLLENHVFVHISDVSVLRKPERLYIQCQHKLCVTYIPLPRH